MQSGPARAAVFAACCDCVNLLTMSGVLGSADGHSRGGSSLRVRRRAAARARLVSQQATSADQRSARTELRHIAAYHPKVCWPGPGLRDRYLQPLRPCGKLALMCKLVAPEFCVSPPRSKPIFLSSTPRAPSIAWVRLVLMLMTTSVAPFSRTL